MAVAALSDSTPGRHGDAPAGALAKCVRQAWPLDARDESEPLGPGCRAELGAVGRQRDQGCAPRRELLDRRTEPQGDLEQGGPGGPAAPGMKRVGGLAEQHHLRDPEGRGRADHRADVLRVLKRDEQRAALGPGILVRPGGQGRHLHQQERGVRPRGVELRETDRRSRRYQSRSARGGGGPSDPVIQASTWPGACASTSATSRGPARIARPCLRIPRASEQVAAELEHRVRLAGHLAHRPAVGPRRGLARRLRGRYGAGLPRQPLVNHAAGARAASRGSGSGGRPPAGTSRRAICSRLGDLGVALGPLHEQHPTAGLQAMRDPVERFRDRRHGPGDHSGDRPGELRADLAGEDLDPFQTQPRADLPQKVGPSPPRLGEDHLELGPRDRQRDARAGRALTPCRPRATAAPRTAGRAGCRHSA